MYPYSVDELVWAITRDREDEVRQIRPHSEEKSDAPESKEPRKPL